MNIDINKNTIKFTLEDNNDRGWLTSMLDIAKSTFETQNLEGIESLVDLNLLKGRLISGTVLEEKEEYLIGDTKELELIFLIVKSVLKLIPKDKNTEKARVESLRIIEDILEEIKKELS